MSMIELELNEEEKAQLLASLASGLSDSTLTHEASTKSVSLKKERKAFKGPPIPVHRDGMGRYVPKHGERPLTEKDIPAPGPAEYAPDYKAVVRKLPEYSMGESAPHIGKKKRCPAPNKYNVTTDLTWGKCKKVTIKHRLPTRLSLFPQDSGPRPGPADYNRQSKTGGPTFTIRNRPKSEAINGLVSSLAKIPDPTVPGPNFRPNEEEWLQHPQTFGTKPEGKRKKIRWPGPTSYNPKVASSSPKWHMGTAARKDATPVGPGPADYDKKPLVPAGPKHAIGQKIMPPKMKFTTPAPNQYSQDVLSLEEPGYSLQYRWYERKEEKTPGPASYRSKDPAAKRSPACTFQGGYPSMTISDTPGPGQYDVSAPPMEKGRSIGRKLTRNGMITPGPNKYRTERFIASQFKNAPCYSLTGKNRVKLDDEDAPGPSTYHVKDNKIEKPGKSLGMRFRRKESSTGPGPAQETIRPAVKLPAENCKACDCDPGATVKSRHTPNKYLGLGILARLSMPPKDVPTAPLLG